MTSGVYLYESVVISLIWAITLTGLVATEWTQHCQFTCLLFFEVKCTRAVSRWCKAWSEYVPMGSCVAALDWCNYSDCKHSSECVLDGEKHVYTEPTGWKGKISPLPCNIIKTHVSNSLKQSSLKHISVHSCCLYLLCKWNDI